jgi:hypothetical protein
MTVASVTRVATKALVRCGLATGLLFGACGCLFASSAQAGIADSEIIVTPFGGNGVFLEYPQLMGLAPVVANQSYDVITKPDGKPHSITVSSGYSLDAILNLAGIPPSSFNYALITTDAESTVLTAAQATSPPTSRDFPIFFETGKHLEFTDANPADYLTGPVGTHGGGLAYVNLYPGPRLSVTLKASPSPAKTGQRVRVTATVKGQLPGETLACEWDNGAELTYGGGNPLIQPFELPGTYYAYAVVTGSKGSVGVSPYISIHVGKVPKGPKRKGGRRA